MFRPSTHTAAGFACLGARSREFVYLSQPQRLSPNRATREARNLRKSELYTER